MPDQDRPRESIELETAYRLLVDRVEDYAIVMLDPEGRVATWNLGAERITGYKAEEILGSPVSRFYTEEAIQQAEPQRHLALAASEGKWGGQQWGVRKDGSRFWADVVLTAHRDEDGHVIAFSNVTRDLTHRKREEDRFRAAVESAPNAMVMVDRAGKIVLVNRQTERLFGYPREEMLEKDVEILVPERFRARHPGYRAQFFGTPQSRAMGAGRDLYGLRKDGTEVPVEIGLNPIETEEGPFVLAAIVDITERKRAEEKFRLAVESALNPMVLVNAQGTIVLVNAQTERLLGYGRGELLGAPVEILVPERFRGHHPAYREDFARRPSIRPMGAGRDLFAVRKDGVEIPVEIGLNPIETEDGHFVLASIVDIAERKRTEEVHRFLSDATKQLAESMDYEETLARVARLALPGFADWCVVDIVEEGTLRRLAIAHVDPAKVKLAQELAQEYPPDPHGPRGVAQVMRTGRTEWSPAIPELMLAEAARDSEHLRILRELGLRSYIVAPLMTRGQVLGTFTVVTAESGREYDERDVAVMEELARRAAMAIDNARTYRAAQDAIRTREDVLAIVSHDLKNPLSAISLSAHVLLRRSATEDPSSRGEIETIQRSAARMKRLIGDLLDMASIQAGRLALSKEPQDGESLVTEALEMQEPLAAEKGIEFLRECRVSGVLLSCDRERVMQIFANLIGNSIKFCGSGDRITVRAEPEGGHVHFSIQDTGPGIPEEDLARIFQPYWTTSGRSREKGVGLGLYITKGIVEVHGGRIWAESRPGKGSTFHFTLPILG